jgi:hypothetical protein
MDAISSSDSIDKELFKKSVSILLLVTDILYQLNKKEIKIPTKKIFHIKSNTTNGIKIIPSFEVSSSIKNLILEIYGNINSIKELL